jgi:hypothetical protein
MAMSKGLILAAVAAVLLAYLQRGDAKRAKIKVIKDSATTEKWLQKYRDVIAEPDYERYRGHVYRVLNIALAFLKDNPKAQKYREVIEVALVFHDIALWTTRDLSYVVPSAAQARQAVTGLSDDESQLMSDIILYHHKLTPFKGANADVVNAVIKADLADFSLGLIRSGFDKDDMAKLREEIPDTGFHRTLNLRIPSIRGWNVLHGAWEVCQIYYY